MLRRGEADAMLCGLVGRYDSHLDHVRHVIGRRPGVRTMAAMNALMLPEHTLFITDTFVNEEPGAEELADIAMMAAAEVRASACRPRWPSCRTRCSARPARLGAAHARGARCSCSVPPTSNATARCRATRRCRNRPCAAASCPRPRSGQANLLVLPNLDAANILFNVLKITGGHGVTVGPMLLGAAAPAHILTPSATVRRVVNMTALAVADAVAAGGPSHPAAEPA
jgi:malate dehydrogenase (oxaloacetate-decarboxylating)(NADP+)